MSSSGATPLARGGFWSDVRAGVVAHAALALNAGASGSSGLGAALVVAVQFAAQGARLDHGRRTGDAARQLRRVRRSPGLVNMVSPATPSRVRVDFGLGAGRRAVLDRTGHPHRLNRASRRRHCGTARPRGASRRQWCSRPDTGPRISTGPWTKEVGRAGELPHFGWCVRTFAVRDGLLSAGSELNLPGRHD